MANLPCSIVGSFTRPRPVARAVNPRPPDKSERATLTVLEQAVQLGFELAEEAPILEAEEQLEVAPFEIVPDSEAKPHENCVPLLSLKAAAGSFGDEARVEAEAWMKPNSRTKPGPGVFVAQVVGESMNRRIPNGSYGVFHPVQALAMGESSSSNTVTSPILT